MVSNIETKTPLFLIFNEILIKEGLIGFFYYKMSTFVTYPSADIPQGEER
jgi:hypothetical protein